SNERQAFGFRCEHRGPDVFADLETVHEIGTRARRAEPLVFRLERDVVFAATDNRCADRALAVVKIDDGAGHEVRRAARAAVVRDLRSENLGETHTMPKTVMMIRLRPLRLARPVAAAL